mmetsp:Transcript_5823/g.13755  ORF Transcript_5823/g.13755 Transcript_5823/m.13755 type:complete len:216 (-) Transcript_5823:309-956(-)
MRPRMWPCSSITFSGDTPPRWCRESMFCVTTALSLPCCSSSAKNLCAGFATARLISSRSLRSMSHALCTTLGSALKFCTVIRAASNVAQREPLSLADGLRKGVMPDSTEIPAPVNATTDCERHTNFATSSALLSCTSGTANSFGVSIMFSAKLRPKLWSSTMQPDSSAGMLQSPEGSCTVRLTISGMPSALRCRSKSICFKTASNLGLASSPYRP